MAFTDAFPGTAGDDLHTYSANWDRTGDGVAFGTLGGSSGSVAIATGSNAAKVNSGASNTWYACTSQGVDGSGRQYVMATLKTTTPQSAFRLTLLANPVTVNGFSLHIHTSSFLHLNDINSNTPIISDNQAVNVNDVIGFDVSGTSPNLSVRMFINGVQRGSTVSGLTNASGATRQGFYVLGGAGTGFDPYCTNFEAGAGPFPTGSSGGSGTPPGRIKTLSGGMHDLTGNMQG